MTHHVFPKARLLSRNPGRYRPILLAHKTVPSAMTVKIWLDAISEVYHRRGMSSTNLSQSFDGVKTDIENIRKRFDGSKRVGNGPDFNFSAFHAGEEDNRLPSCGEIPLF